jgi:hypothetical protein
MGGQIMGRKPIGEVAMTPAERQRKRREKMAEKARYLPGVEWSDFVSWCESRKKAFACDFLEQLEFWLGWSDEEVVAQFLSEAISANSLARGKRIAQRVTKSIAKERIEIDQRRVRH